MRAKMTLNWDAKTLFIRVYMQLSSRPSFYFIHAAFCWILLRSLRFTFHTCNSSSDKAVRMQ